MLGNNQIKSTVQLAVAKNDIKAIEYLIENGITVIPYLVEVLSSDLPISLLEKYENVYKLILRNLMKPPIAGNVARAIASFQKEIGFVLKYKPYAIKASTPLGYSLFLQKKNEGFSFQRHIDYKTEVFHIVSTSPDSYVFICDYEEWIKIYDFDSFLEWLNGSPDLRYERFTVKPNPGDVFIIDKLNVVHSVVGCTLEEYATVSTDKVDRLFDQNKNKPIPQKYSRSYFETKFRAISYPLESSIITNEKRSIPIAWEPINGGNRKLLANTEKISAAHYLIDPLKMTDFQGEQQKAILVNVQIGQGKLIIADTKEAKKTSPPHLDISSGDVLIVPPGINYCFVNESNAQMGLSEHKISPALALAY